MTKDEARKKALALRKTNAKCDDKIIDYIISNKLIDNFKSIGLYYPIGKEINIMELVNKFPDKEFYLPITKDNMYFARYENILVDGPFKTKEPIGCEFPRDNIECFIIPCVAIGKDNRRIGYGKGYYDKYLEGYKGFKIGVVYNNSIFDCECDIYDVRLDIVVSGE